MFNISKQNSTFIKLCQSSFFIKQVLAIGEASVSCFRQVIFFLQKSGHKLRPIAILIWCDAIFVPTQVSNFQKHTILQNSFTWFWGFKYLLFLTFIIENGSGNLLQVTESLYSWHVEQCRTHLNAACCIAMLTSKISFCEGFANCDYN